MKWIYKAAVQKIVSFLPFSHRINFLFHRYSSMGRELPDTFVLDKITHAQKHLNSFYKLGTVPIEKADFLEIGTGWYPIVPVIFFMSGANHIETTDIRKLYSKVSINQTIRAILRIYNHSLLKVIPNLRNDRIKLLQLALQEKTTQKKLQLLNIKATICKCTNYSIRSDSKDLIVSNNTLQLIKKKDLQIFFAELLRIGKTNSIISLAIDFTDEFSHSDKSISNYNFLKFSDWEWKIISNRLNSPNRLRYSDFKDILPGSLQIVTEEIISGEPQELKTTKIHKKFSYYTVNDLLIKYSYIAAINKKLALL